MERKEEFQVPRVKIGRQGLRQGHPSQSVWKERKSSKFQVPRVKIGRQGLRELGIDVVAYSPLGLGFFAGRANTEGLPEGSILALNARFNGTTKINHLDANIGFLKVKLSEEDLKEVFVAVPTEEVGGERDIDLFTGWPWKFANT
ncbi:hypothetical protein COCNU_scaffold006313G000010 [Cocos nucifera]|nr:hypothetical protein [Cocos nucifera]